MTQLFARRQNSGADRSPHRIACLLAISVLAALLVSIGSVRADEALSVASPITGPDHHEHGCKIDCSVSPNDPSLADLDADSLGTANLTLSSAMTAGPSIQILHVIPAGATPRYSDMAERIPLTIDAVQVFLQSDVGRTLRYEPGITTVTVTEPGNFVEQLQARGFNDVNTIYLSFVESTSTTTTDACGFSRGNHALLLMPRCDIYPGSGPQVFPSNATYLVLHELLHALGAVPACAPSYDGTGHATDSTQDILGPGPRDWPNLTVDAGRDDYYGHSNSGCTDVEDSLFWLSGDPCLIGWSDVTAASFAAEAVQWATCNEITAGISPTRFGPSATVTRAQMATFLWRFAGEPTGSPAHGFSDVPAGSWFDAPVAWMAAEGITSGTTATTFDPHGAVTRAQMAALLWRFSDEPAGAPAHGFSDVEATDYFDAAVAWMLDVGITTGTSASTYSPSARLTRAQAVTFLWRLAGEPE